VRDERGYTLAEMVVVIAVLGIVVGGISTLFARGISADADQTRRFHAQQDGRLALDKLRREIHAACTVSNPTTYNTWESSITLYFSSDNCVSGTHTVSWCVIGSGTRYGLYRIVSSSCTGATSKYASYLTSSSVFVYLPPDSYVATNGLGKGTSATYVTTAATDYSLPKLHVAYTINRKPTFSLDQFKVNDDIVFRNGPRSCTSGATC
jgi:prepilin-type N-terminal cleavage/methylation domain-containing protein